MTGFLCNRHDPKAGMRYQRRVPAFSFARHPEAAGPPQTSPRRGKEMSMTTNQRSNANRYCEQSVRVRELAHEVRHGNDDAFATLWDLVRPYAASVARMRLAKFGADPDHLEDILSETTVRILHAVRTTFNPDRPWKPFLATVVRNCVKDHVDKLTARRETSLDEISGSDDPTGTPENSSSGQTKNK